MKDEPLTYEEITYYANKFEDLCNEKDKEIERLNNTIEYLLKFIEDMFDEEAISNSFDMTTKEFINYIKSKLKGE